MSYNPHGSPSLGHPLAVGQAALPAGLSSPDHPSPSRRIAIPTQGGIPSFDRIYSLAMTATLLDQATLILCLTEEVLTLWRHQLQQRVKAMEGLELVDGRFGWSVDWRAFFRSRHHDIVFLHGLLSALQDQSIPLSYAKRLVSAASAGLIVLA